MMRPVTLRTGPLTSWSAATWEHAGTAPGAYLRIADNPLAGTSLDGVRFAWLLSFPGPVHEANGTRQVVIDAHASQEQRAALLLPAAWRLSQK